MSQQSCFHCGDPVPSHLDIHSSIDGKDAFFCCYGCQAITEFIKGSDLSAYYQHRTDSPGTLSAQDQQKQQDQLKLISDPEIYPLFVYEEQGLHHIQLQINGMTCAACAWLIEKRLNNMKGVASFHINLSTSIASLCWSPDECSLSDIGLEINHLGYGVSPHRPDVQEESRKIERKRSIIRLGLAGVGMMQVMMSAIALYAGDLQGMEESYRQLLRWSSFAFSTPVVLYAAQPFFRAAFRDLRTRHFTMDLSVSLGIGLAYISSVYALFVEGGTVYFDSVTMFTFFLLLGRFLEESARHRFQGLRSQRQELLAVSRITEGQSERIPVSRIRTGDLLEVAPGETFCVDGVIVNGATTVDESSLTGEYLPVSKQTGDEVTASTINVDQPIRIRVTAIGAQTRSAAIERLTERALAEKPAVALLADKVAHYFVMAVICTAALTYFGWSYLGSEDAYWIMVSVLVVTCPCALSLATPVALTAATNRIRDLGLLITRGHVIEALSACRHLVFDKTGTLTFGQFDIVKTSSDHPQPSLEICAALEANSVHPIAQAFAPYLKKNAVDVVHFAGRGVEGEIDGTRYRLGNQAFVEEWGISVTLASHSGLTLYLANHRSLLAVIYLKDRLRPNVVDSLEYLKKQGYQLSLLTGDTRTSALDLLPEPLFDHFITGLTPEQKWEWLANHPDRKQQLMLGDGLNDVPSLAGANTSIAMADSSDLAKVHADAILFSGQIDLLPKVINKAKQCRRIIKQNLTWAVLYNGTLLPLAVMGFIPPWAAAIGMAASSLVVVVNAGRL